MLKVNHITNVGEGVPAKIRKGEFKEYLDNLDAFQEAGPDNINLRLLKELAESFSEQLTIIFKNEWLASQRT